MFLHVFLHHDCIITVDAICGDDSDNERAQQTTEYGHFEIGQISGKIQ